MKTSPLISFVIPARNEEKYIEDCISSIKQQDLADPYEIIVVDNASTDNTADVAKQLEVKVVTERQKGLCYARQAGLDAAEGEILIYLDADTRIQKKWAGDMINIFKANPDIVGVSCNFTFYDATLVTKLALYFFQEVIGPLTLFLAWVFKKPDFLFGHNIVLRTQALRRAGGINKNFIFYGEDTALAYSLRTQGKVVYLQDKYVKVSARRYQQKGLKKLNIFFDWFIYILMIFGFDKPAKRISAAYILKHR